MMSEASDINETRDVPNGKRANAGPAFGDLNNDSAHNKERGCIYYFKKFDD
jgi:hypothetical protein